MGNRYISVPDISVVWVWYGREVVDILRLANNHTQIQSHDNFPPQFTIQRTQILTMPKFYVRLLLLPLDESIILIHNEMP